MQSTMDVEVRVSCKIIAEASAGGYGVALERGEDAVAGRIERPHGGIRSPAPADTCARAASLADGSAADTLRQHARDSRPGEVREGCHLSG